MGPQQGSNYSIPVIGQRLIEFLRGEALQQSIVYSGQRVHSDYTLLCATVVTLVYSAGVPLAVQNQAHVAILSRPYGRWACICWLYVVCSGRGNCPVQRAVSRAGPRGQRCPHCALCVCWPLSQMEIRFEHETSFHELRLTS